MSEPVKPSPAGRQALIARGEQLLLLVLGLAVVAGVAYRAVCYWRIGADPLEVVPADVPGHQVDVNAATWAELSLVPGLGQALSQRIVALRQERGGRLKSLDDLKAVRGINDRILDRLRPYLFVGTDRPADAEPIRMTDEP